MNVSSHIKINSLHLLLHPQTICVVSLFKSSIAIIISLVGMCFILMCLDVLSRILHMSQTAMAFKLSKNLQSLEHWIFNDLMQVVTVACIGVRWKACACPWLYTTNLLHMRHIELHTVANFANELQVRSATAEAGAAGIEITNHNDYVTTLGISGQAANGVKQAGYSNHPSGNKRGEDAREGMPL